MEFAEGYELLRSGASRFGVEVSEEQWACFYKYMRLLQDWNSRINLTSITEDPGIITKHFVDCLSIVPHIREAAGDSQKVLRLCDIGTGAGFPGIPVKILMPELNVCLVDSLNKRLLFLDEVIRALGLKGIETVHMRAEDFGRDSAFRNKFDFSTARAVAPMNVLLELCTPALKPGGLFLAMKGGRDEGPFAGAAGKLCCKLEKTDRFTIDTAEEDGSFSSSERIIYVFRKAAPTPPAFPRKAGIPSKKPL